MRKPLALVVVSALASLMVPSAARAASGGACQVDGTANFSPALTNTAGNFTYDFGATLSGCQSNEAGAPASGKADVGKVFTVSSGERFQEPRASGSGTCANGTTNGTAIVTWADGTRTVLRYTTTSVTAGVQQSGNVVPSITIPAINPLPGEPTSLTIDTTRYGGDTANGLLTFQADPTACAGAGVSSAAVSGAIGIGTTS